MVQTTPNLHATLNPTAQEFTPKPNHIPFPVTVAVPYSYSHHATTLPPHLSTVPTRSLLLSPLPPTPESFLSKDLQSFGDVKGIRTVGIHYGILTVDFYDLRHAQSAFAALRTHHVQSVSFFNQLSHPKLSTAPPPPPPGVVAGVPLWAHYVVSDAQNQGTLVVFNLEDDVSPDILRRVFEPFGDIKEVRETAGKKKSERFVEFFDTRDAAKALEQMNGKEINGKSVVIEFSKPSGYGRKFFHSTNYPNPTPNPNFYVYNNKPFYYSNVNANYPPASPQRRFVPPQLSYKGSLSRVSSIGSISCWNESQYSPRRNFGRSPSSESGVGERGWNWKGRDARKNENYFVIKEDAIVESESRTTLMIKNIPNKYSQKLLLNMLDNHCKQCNQQIADGDDQPLSSYDFLYLPIDFKNKCNVGYGFVNMTSPEATLRFYKAFNHQPWEVFNSKKICQLTFARIQGLEALKEHFKNSKFPCETDHYLPAVFSPPRDGKQLTEATPLVGNTVQTAPAVVVGSGSDDTVYSKSGGVDGDEKTQDVK